MTQLSFLDDPIPSPPPAPVLHRSKPTGSSPLTEIVRSSRIIKSQNGFNLVLPEIDPISYRSISTIVSLCGGKYVNKNKGFKFRSDPDITIESICSNLLLGPTNRNSEQFFPTPDQYADTLLEELTLYSSYADYLLGKTEDDRKKTTILEPSAGTGNLIRAVLRKYPDFAGTIHVFEIDELRKSHIRQIGHPSIVIHDGDFLTNRHVLPPIDICLMNPPFANWTDHVSAALDCLSQTASGENSYLAAILPNLRTTLPKGREKKDYALDFLARALATGQIESLPDDAFNSSQTDGPKASIKTETYIVQPTKVTDNDLRLATIMIENDSDCYNTMHRMKRSSSFSVAKIESWLNDTRQQLIQKTGSPVFSDQNFIHRLAKDLANIEI